ncbi:serine aminopeptidase domain-containing protein [Thalassotalea sp. PLHSN55]|uniref:serine aminopeptidase domain-containing protein n=1 Tax=Thalassotalea sp. PLHSN55 TaxID=3435888 RepID=UPI003F87E0D8
MQGLMLLVITILVSVSSFTLHAQQTLTIALDPQEVTIPTKDNFPLMADYFAGDSKSAGVLLLHGCSNSRQVFTDLGKTLAQHNMHALALDYRGYGASVSEKFSQRSIKQQAQDIIGYQAEMMKITMFWNGDVFAAHQYLADKISKNRGISVIAIDCAIEQAVALAERMRINALVALTPQMSEMDKERYKNLLDFPVYFIASTHSTDSYNTADELFKWNGDKNSKFQSIKGDRSAYSILRRYPEIAQDIAIWLKTKSLDGRQ